MRTIPLAAATVVACLLAGCAGPSAPTPRSSPSASPSASPSPSPSPQPSKPALADLVIEPEGLGPLRVGQAPPVTDPAIDILVFDPDACDFVPEWDPSYVPSGDLGLWISNYG